MLTFGDGAETDDLKKVAENLGNKVIDAACTHVTFDEINKIVTVPGNSSGDRSAADVYMSIDAMVQQINNFIKAVQQPDATISVVTRIEVNKGRK